MKKAESQYISWILIFALVVSISYMLFNWSVEQAEETADRIDKAGDPTLCAEVGLSVEGACQDFRSIELNVSNTNIQELVGLSFRMVPLYPDSDPLENVNELQVISPGYTERMILIKKSTLAQVKIIPIAKKGTRNVICEEKAVLIEILGLKQC